MTAAERALATIDDGLQRAGDVAIYSAPAEGSCWRCTRRKAAEGSDLCAPCRAFLLEDTDVDPASSLTPEEIEAIVAFVNELFDVVRPILEAIVDFAAKFLERFGPTIAEIERRFRPLFGDSARAESPSRIVVPPGRLPPVGTRRTPTMTRDLRTTEAPRAAPTPRRRIRP